MQYLTIIIFFTLLLLLNYLRSVIARQIQISSVLIFNTNKAGIIFYSLFFLPGVLIHELSHLITAGILGVRTGEIHIFPTEIKPGSIKMGSVASAESDPFREILIGAAPVLTGITIITGVVLYMLNSFNLLLNFENIILIYLVYTVSNTMFVSSEDTRSFWFIPVIIIGVGAFIYVFNINYSQAIGYAYTLFTYVNQALVICNIINIFSLLAFYTVNTVISRTTGRKVVFHQK